MHPLVTVITVTYNIIKANRKEAFCRAVASVQNQTYCSIEHIVIDGASDDGTLDLLRPYEQSGKLTVYSEPDTGIYNAMNKGLSRAKGKYIIYLNSDDFWHKSDGIEQSVLLLEMCKADFSIAPHTLQKENGRIVGVCTPSPASFFANMPFCHQTMLARTERLREIGGFDETFTIAADYDLVTRLMLRGAHPVYTACNFTTFCEGGISTRLDVVSKQDEERKRVFHKNYDSLIGHENAEKLFKGAANEEILRTLSYMVHPSVSQHFSSIVKNYNNGRYLTVSGGAVRKDPQEITIKISSLFNIPILKKRITPIASHYKVFGFLPLFSTSIKPTAYSTHSYALSLFGIPFLRYEYSEQTTKALLFGCITIYKKKYINK